MCVENGGYAFWFTHVDTTFWGISRLGERKIEGRVGTNAFGSTPLSKHVGTTFFWTYPL